jgi:hypothetical protein
MNVSLVRSLSVRHHLLEEDVPAQMKQYVQLNGRPQERQPTRRPTR